MSRLIAPGAKGPFACYLSHDTSAASGTPYAWLDAAIPLLVARIALVYDTGIPEIS